MATKKKPTKTSTTATKVTRITASTDAPQDDVVATAEKPAKARAPKVKKEHRNRNPLRAIGRYFAGAWFELRHVIWPTRRATWGMTGALISFTLFFVIIILLCDWGFQSLFNLLLGS